MNAPSSVHTPAQKNFTIKWLQKMPPTLEECLRTVREMYVMEKIRLRMSQFV